MAKWIVGLKNSEMLQATSCYTDVNHEVQVTVSPKNRKKQRFESSITILFSTRRFVEFSTNFPINKQGSDFTASGNARIRTCRFSLRVVIN
jgi:hypothetical protein